MFWWFCFDVDFFDFGVDPPPSFFLDFFHNFGHFLFWTIPLLTCCDTWKIGFNFSWYLFGDYEIVTPAKINTTRKYILKQDSFLVSTQKMALGWVEHSHLQAASHTTGVPLFHSKIFWGGSWGFGSSFWYSLQPNIRILWNECSDKPVNWDHWDHLNFTFVWVGDCLLMLWPFFMRASSIVFCG